MSQKTNITSLWPLIFAILFLLSQILNGLINEVWETDSLILGGIFVIFFAVFYFAEKKSRTQSTQLVEKKPLSQTSQQTEKKPLSQTPKHTEKKPNLELYKKEIDEYEQFLGQVYLCTKKSFANTSTYVCIHKKSKELYSFTAKIIGSRGIFDVYCFHKQPSRITTYEELIIHLDAITRRYFDDLNKTNWTNYFEFMFREPNHNSDTLRKQLLSKDKGIVRDAAFAVINSTLKDPQERKNLLADSHEKISLIKSNKNTLEMGGIFASNSRFLNRAITVIEKNNSNECCCRLVIDEFGSSANGLSRNNGFILVEPDKPINDYSKQGVIECPVCHKKYSIIEEYTGWHIPTTIHCSEIIE